MKKRICTSAVLALLGLFPQGFAQTPPPAAVPAGPATTLPSDWEQIDERLVFLTVRLSSDEASLQAVNRAIKQTGYQQNLKKSDAEGYRKGNELMDRKAGGPVRWEEFYGRTAEKFFYHPTDRNSRYLTVTELAPHSPKNVQSSGVASANEGVPPQQRPPQFDYIYRANTDAQKRAQVEAAALGGKIDKLLARRRQLEAEQSALWCEIAFDAVASRELSSKPLYRFDLKSAATDPNAGEHLEAARAACDFVRAVDHLMSDAQQAVESRQEQVYQQLPTAITAARKTMVDRLSHQESLTLDLADPQSQVGKVAACAKRLEDLTRNIIESYHLAADGDEAGDDQRKDTFRGQLQDKLMSSAETLFTMNMCITELANAWNLTPDVKKPLNESETRSVGTALSPATSRPAPLAAVTPPRSPSVTDRPANQATSGSRDSGTAISLPHPSGSPAEALHGVTADLLAECDLKNAVHGKWERTADGLVCGPAGRMARLPLGYRPKGEYDMKVEFTRLNGNRAVTLLLSHRGHRFMWAMGASYNAATGFDIVGGKAAGQNNASVSGPMGLTNNRRYVCVVRVRNSGVEAYLDGKLLVQYQTDFSEMTRSPGWDIDTDQLGIGCFDRTLFQVVQVTE